MKNFQVTTGSRYARFDTEGEALAYADEVTVAPHFMPFVFQVFPYRLIRDS